VNIDDARMRMVLIGVLLKLRLTSYDLADKYADLLTIQVVLSELINKKDV
jgi:hypothetical protein